MVVAAVDDADDVVDAKHDFAAAGAAGDGGADDFANSNMPFRNHLHC